MEALKRGVSYFPSALRRSGEVPEVTAVELRNRGDGLLSGSPVRGGRKSALLSTRCAPGPARAKGFHGCFPGRRHNPHVS